MNAIRTHIRTLRTQLERIPHDKWGKQAFLLKLNGKKAKILDIGELSRKLFDVNCHPM